MNKHGIRQDYDFHNHQKCHFTSSRLGAVGQSGMQGGKLTSEPSTSSTPFSTGTEQSNALKCFVKAKTFLKGLSVFYPPHI